MLPPASTLYGTPHPPARAAVPGRDRTTGTDTGTPQAAPADPYQSTLDRLPTAGSHGQEVVAHLYAACAADTSAVASIPAFDSAPLRERLAEWRAQANADLPAATERQVNEDLKSALIAAAAIGVAHSVEMILLAYSNHPLVRLSAVSHPYVVATFLESFMKRLADVHDPDPANRTGIRYREKVVAALVNWNHVQPALDTVLKTPLSRCLKVVATSVISAVRDVAERAETLALLKDLPADAPAGPSKLTDGETLFVNCLMCWLRNVGVDLIRHLIRKGGEAGAPLVLPAARGMVERLSRPVFLGSHVPGGLPAAAISAQPAFAEALRKTDESRDGWSRSNEILQQSHQLF